MAQPQGKSIKRSPGFWCLKYFLQLNCSVHHWLLPKVKICKCPSGIWVLFLFLFFFLVDVDNRERLQQSPGHPALFPPQSESATSARGKVSWTQQFKLVRITAGGTGTESGRVPGDESGALVKEPCPSPTKLRL